MIKPCGLAKSPAAMRLSIIRPFGGGIAEFAWKGVSKTPSSGNGFKIFLLSELFFVDVTDRIVIIEFGGEVLQISLLPK